MRKKWLTILFVLIVTLGTVLIVVNYQENHKVVPSKPEKSDLFQSVQIEDSDTINTQSQGDLWASCWADDDYLYAANGDGDGFTVKPPNSVNIPPNPAHNLMNDIAISKINGAPENLSGETVSSGNQIGQIWNNPNEYNRKPTGMVCVDGDLYLAVQDLNKDFNDVPSATIVKSSDKGKTWKWDTEKPMFDNHIFTTIMFLDYGKDNEHAKDNYIYAYGLDNNWRDSFNNRVEDPTNLFLARVPKTKILDRSSWEFYTGEKFGKQKWSKEIKNRVPVLQDERILYKDSSA